MDERRVQAGRNSKVKYVHSVKTIMPRLTQGLCEAGPLCGRQRRGGETLKDSSIEAIDILPIYEHNYIYTPSRPNLYEVWPRNPAIRKLRRSSARPPCILTLSM